MSSEFEGKSIGTKAVDIACRLFPTKQLSAVVHSKNIGSLKLFGRAGFAKMGNDGVFFLLKKGLK